MRVGTFNILHGRSPADGRVDPGRLADAVRGLDVDVLALQEVDRFRARSGRVDLAAVAADAMGAVDHRFVAATGDEPPDAAAYGVALVSRHPVRDWRVVRLPRFVRDEPRVAVAAVVSTPEGDVTVVGTHLSFLAFWNSRQLRQLASAVTDSSRSLVLAGDLNMGPVRAARLSGMRVLAAHPTFPSPRPSRQLDHLLGAGPVVATGSEARALPVSDHLALVADLRLG